MTLLGSQDAGDDLDGGSLTGAVGAEQADDCAPMENERYPVQDFRVAVAEDDLVERGDRFRQGGLLAS